jgi:phosphoribosylaminoimidazole-succinocarboxamide synthase
MRHKAPEGLKESSRLESPIFTPSTKAEEGHDINISFDEAVKLSAEIATKLRDASLKIIRRPGDG